MATRDLTRDGTAATKRSGVYTLKRSEADEAEHKAHKPPHHRLRRSFPSEGKPWFLITLLNDRTF